MDQLNHYLLNMPISVNMWISIFWSSGELLRYRLLEVIQPWFSLTDFELFPGLVFGDTHVLTPQLKQDLKTIGMLHALSASGTNVGIVSMFATHLFTSTHRTIKLVGSLLCLVVYLCLVGESAPIIRAVLARLYIYIGWYFHLQATPILAWFFSAATMAAIRPAFVFELSYQLSVLASLGITLLLPRLSLDNLEQPRWLTDIFREAFWQTAAAQLFVLPLTFTIFGESPTSSLLTNTILAPFLTLLTLTAFFIAGFGALYGLLSTYDHFTLLLMLQGIKIGLTSIYRLINQSFIATIAMIHYQAAVINQHVAVWWVIGLTLLLFAFHFGQHYRRMHYSLKLVQQL